MEKVSRKIAVPKEGGQQQKGFQVQEYHLDTNHHVNNGQYVRMATAYLPDDFPVREMRAEYRRQAKLGDMRWRTGIWWYCRIRRARSIAWYGLSGEGCEDFVKECRKT